MIPIHLNATASRSLSRLRPTRLVTGVLLLSLAACGLNRGVEVISAKDTAAAFADVKNQLLDYQNHMNWLAEHPEQDDALKDHHNEEVICGTRGGLRLDIVSAVATLNLQVGTAAGFGGVATGTGGSVSGGLLSFGKTRTSTVINSYAVEIVGEQKSQKGGKTALAQALLNQRSAMIESQYLLRDKGRGCIQQAKSETSNFVSIKLVTARTGSGGISFFVGDSVIGPSISGSRAVDNTLTVKFVIRGPNERPLVNKANGSAASAIMSLPPDTQLMTYPPILVPQ